MNCLIDSLTVVVFADLLQLPLVKSNQPFITDTSLEAKQRIGCIGTVDLWSQFQYNELTINQSGHTWWTHPHTPGWPQTHNNSLKITTTKSGKGIWESTWGQHKDSRSWEKVKSVRWNEVHANKESECRCWTCERFNRHCRRFQHYSATLNTTHKHHICEVYSQLFLVDTVSCVSRYSWMSIQ